jgi:hypothetical protein
MRRILFAVTAFLLWCNGAFCENPLFEQLQTAVLERDETGFLALALPDATTQRHQQEFTRSVFDFLFKPARFV